MPRELRAILYYIRAGERSAEAREGQLNMLQAWCNAQSFVVVATEVDSPGKPDRKQNPRGLRRALRMLEDGQAELLVVPRASSVASTPGAVLKLAARVLALGSHLVSMEDGPDLDTREGAIRQIIEWRQRMQSKLRASPRSETRGRPRLTISGKQIAGWRSQGVRWTDVAVRLGCDERTARRRLKEWRERRRPKTV